jgi:hypothetical protein
MTQTVTLPDWNLEPLLVKALDAEEGYGWTLDLALDVAAEYRKYSALCQLYPDEPLVPSTFVDDFWHLHILDTLKYEDDCSQYYGYFLHHFPYFGMRGEEDAANLRKSWLATLELYKKHFGEVPADLWPSSKRCPNCGVRCRGKQHEAAFEQRPSLADILK